MWPKIRKIEEKWKQRVKEARRKRERIQTIIPLDPGPKKRKRYGLGIFKRGKKKKEKRKEKEERGTKKAGKMTFR